MPRPKNLPIPKRVQATLSSTHLYPSAGRTGCTRWRGPLGVAPACRLPRRCSGTTPRTTSGACTPCSGHSSPLPQMWKAPQSARLARVLSSVQLYADSAVACRTNQLPPFRRPDAGFLRMSLGGGAILRQKRMYDWSNGQVASTAPSAWG